MMRTALFALAAISLQLVGGRSVDPSFSVNLISPGASESAAVADVDGDGRTDVVSGDSWYRAPDWTPHRFRDVGFSGGYIDSFSVLPVDVDEDGHVDIVDVSWFARRIAWWRNPGTTAGTTMWREEPISSCCNVEFAVLADMNNDGRAHEIVAQENGTGQAWYEIRSGAWVRHAVSDRTHGHGIGAGDVNGDGRNDILTPAGWLEAPADPRTAGWSLHEAWASVNTPVPAAGTPAPPSVPGAAPDTRRNQLGFMHVVDVNGDGRNDVITAAGHDYGIFWFEQSATGWTKRVIDNAWSQGHASALADVNGDGRVDFVSGKRFMAHNGADPGEREPLGIYWYEWRLLPPAAGPAGGQVPSGPRRVEWMRHVIEYGGRVGAGMQLVAVDLDTDKDTDLVMGGKSGLFWLENHTSGRR